MRTTLHSLLALLALFLLPALSASAENVSANTAKAVQRFESFDQDPNWDGYQNRSPVPECRITKQDFGWSQPTAHAGGKPGELGGFLQPAADLASYGKAIPERTFDAPLHAEGKLTSSDAYARGHVNVGYYQEGAHGWRVPNSINIRLLGRGAHLYAYLGYCTDKWRAGEYEFENPDGSPYEFPINGTVLEWSISYDPKGNGGGGIVTATIGDVTGACPLNEGHKLDGVRINRFGLCNISKSNDDGMEFWLDDLVIDGEPEDFTDDPKWEEFQNRRTYEDCLIRPRFDFGFSPTNHAGGKPGEMGGVVFRGDFEYPEEMAHYGDRVESLTLDGPLVAEGKMTLLRGISDSTAIIGWFHDEKSRVGGTGQATVPQDFLGVMIEGPSSEGFLFRPAYRFHEGDQFVERHGPEIYPDGAQHTWKVEYNPNQGAAGTITATLGGKSVTTEVIDSHRATGAEFNRFGIVTVQIDGNYQFIYFDDLSYTYKHEPPGK